MELCRSIAESMPLMVWIAGADGAAILCNRRVCAYTGLGAHELEGWGWIAALHPDDRARVEQCWRQALASGESYQAEIRLRRHDGAYRWHLDTASPLKDASGRIIGWLGLCTDIDPLVLGTGRAVPLHLFFPRCGRDRRLIGWGVSPSVALGYALFGVTCLLAGSQKQQAV